MAHTCDLRVCLAEVGRAPELQATWLHSKTPLHKEKKTRFISAHFSESLVICLWAWVTQHIMAGSAWQRKLLICGGQETKERGRNGGPSIPWNTIFQWLGFLWPGPTSLKFSLPLQGLPCSSCPSKTEF